MDIPRKGDGSIDFDRWFTGKSKDEQKVLAKGLENEVDYDAYIAWKEAVNEGKTATVIKLQNENKERYAKNKELDAQLLKIQNKNKELDAKLLAQNQAWLGQLRSIYALTGGNFNPKIQKQIHDALHDNTVPDFIKRELQKLLNKEDTAPSK